jgi:flagellar FliL protein
MADKPATAAHDPPSGDATASGGKSKILGKIKVVAIVVTIVVGECALAYVYVGSAPEGSSAHAEESAAAQHKAEEPATDEPTDSKEQQGVEVLLGEFNVTSYQPLANTTLRISFKLYGIVKPGDESDLKSRLDEKKHTFREHVLMILRSSEMNDLADPMLGLIKRKILEKTNRLVGKPLLRGVIFSDFSYFEQ